MLTERISKRLSTPQKHPTVPEEIARINKFPCPGQVRLFCKSTHSQRAITIFSARLNVSVACFRASGPDAKHHDVVSRCGDLDCSADSSAVLGLISDDVSGGKQTEHRIGILTKQKKRR